MHIFLTRDGEGRALPSVNHGGKGSAHWRPTFVMLSGKGRGLRLDWGKIPRLQGLPITFPIPIS